MDTGTATLAEARARVYFALAEALVEPHADTLDLLLAAAALGAQVLQSAACRTAQVALAALPRRHGDGLQQEYRQVMQPSAGRPPALYESLFREGRLMGPAALAVERYYRALGLAPGEGELPDHASVELAFMGNLAVVEADARRTGSALFLARVRSAYRRFLRSHAAPWLPELGAALAGSGCPFYRAVGGWLRAFVEEEVRGRRGVAASGAYRIRLHTPEACTLCGLCTGCCKTGALFIHETEHATCLALAEAACVNCDRCVAICPEQVLFADTSATARVASCAGSAPRGLGEQVLRTSRRLNCPGCGQPTVSEAEWHGVLARLGAVVLDPKVQARLQLCVTCKGLL